MYGLCASWAAWAKKFPTSQVASRTPCHKPEADEVSAEGTFSIVLMSETGSAQVSTWWWWWWWCWLYVRNSVTITRSGPTIFKHVHHYSVWRTETLALHKSKGVLYLQHIASYDIYIYIYKYISGYLYWDLILSNHHSIPSNPNYPNSSSGYLWDPNLRCHHLRWRDTITPVIVMNSCRMYVFNISIHVGSCRFFCFLIEHNHLSL